MSDGYQGGDLFSTSVRAGKRTYFFDVKATRGNDLFLTITESKKVGFQEEGPVHFEKHKIFLYKEDFDGFMEALNEAMTEIRNKQGKDGFRSAESPRRAGFKPEEQEEAVRMNGGDVSFEDLDSESH